MWTETARPKYERTGLRYASDLTPAEWAVIGPFLPPRKRLGRPRTTAMREVVNAILYMARTGCQWRMLPKDFPPKSTVQEYFYAWRADGTLKRINHELLLAVREADGRDLKQAVEGFGREFSRTMAEALVTGDFTFKSLGQSFLVNFAEKVIQQRITDPLFSAFSGFLDNLSFGDLFGGGGGASSTALSLTGPRFTFAHGGVIDQGAVQAFAAGGVINRPTLFRLASGAGLMGEAGPEAILPLARTPSGDLGVKAAGGGAGVNVTIVNNTAEPVQTRTSRRGNQGRDLEVVIGRLVSRDLRSGGETFKAVRETFNLAPATALR